MKIALISPRGSFISKNDELHRFWSGSALTATYRQNWSGLATSLLVIAALTPPHIEVDLVDENIEGIDFTRKYDIVGITAMTQQATRAYEIADRYRTIGTYTVIGGLHATLLPDEAKEHADSVIIGEAEHTWASFIDDFVANDAKPFYRPNGEVDLSKSPLPRYDLIDSKHYSVVWVQASRGCPHDCEFCVSSKVFGSRYRYKNVSTVLGEIRFVKDRFANSRIGFADDNLFVNQAFSEELLKAVAPLGIRWAGQSDIAIAESPRMLELIRKSGCTFLFIGLESLDRACLSEINKSEWKLRKLARYPEYIKEIQDHGIGVMGSFIFGFDRDTADVFDSTADFVIENDLYDAQFSILTPFPGTRIRDKLSAENRLLPTCWENYSVYDVNFIPKSMSVDQLQKGLLHSYVKINTVERYERRMKHFKEIYRKIV